MSCRNRQNGATLIEVLIAVLVLSIGLLGALKLQTEGVRQNADSRYTSLASALAHDAMDAITFNRFNDKAAWLAIDTIASPASCASEAQSSSASASASSASGTSTGRAQAWAERLACDLPGGQAKIVCTTTNVSAANTCAVTLKWTPPGRDTVTAEYKMYQSAASSAAASSTP